MKRRGFTLIEVIASLGLSLIALGIGYQAYFGVLRADDVERRREQISLSAQNAMARIKQDVRRAESVSASDGSMEIGAGGERILYENTRSGVARVTGNSRSLFKGISASFATSGRGVMVSVRGRANVHRRSIRVEITSFVVPRG